ncbi:MAG: SDR family NAD(P)-dependent oxidoreductase [Bacteroidota bacterium]
MRKALVTGADGFIGSHLVNYLLEHGWQVRAFVLYNSFQSNGWLDSFPKEERKKIEIFQGDIRDRSRVIEAMTGVDVVFNLAALIAIPYSYVASQSYVDVNVTGTLNVLEAAKMLGTSRVILLSTSEVYGTAQYIPIDEKHPIQAQSPYSATKIAGESLGMAYLQSFDVPVTVVRPFNTFGPRQSIRAVIPTIIIQLLRGKEKLLLGDSRPTRDFLFVKDHVSALERISQHPATIGKTLNIATGSEISIGELAQTLIDKINPLTEIVMDPKRFRPNNSEVKRLLGDAKLLRELTDWEPTFGLEKGLNECINWYKKEENLKLFPEDYSL